jgi:hypothetical protein
MTQMKRTTPPLCLPPLTPPRGALLLRRPTTVAAVLGQGVTSNLGAPAPALTLALVLVLALALGQQQR